MAGASACSAIGNGCLNLRLDGHRRRGGEAVNASASAGANLFLIPTHLLGMTATRSSSSP